MSNKIKAFLITIIIGIVSTILGVYLKSIGSITICLIFGIGLKQLLKSSEIEKEISSYSKHFLSLSIISLGLGLSFQHLKALGFPLLAFVILLVLISIFLSKLIGKALSIDTETSMLIGIGSGICGSSAIGACAQLVSKDLTKSASSIAVINVVGLVGLFMYPFATGLLQLGPQSSSLLIGGTLQSLGHVAASAGMINEEIVAKALTIKMGRVLLLVPTILFLSFTGVKNKSKNKTRIPYYIFGFILTLLLTNIVELPIEVLELGKKITKWSLVLAMVGIGLSIDIKSFFKATKSLLVLATSIQLIQILLVIGFLGLK